MMLLYYGKHGKKLKHSDFFCVFLRMSEFFRFSILNFQLIHKPFGQGVKLVDAAVT